LSIADCSELPVAATNTKHPCRTIVDVQADAGPARHVPEPWAGNLVEGRVLFISSNPSLSEADDHQSGDVVERYPLACWPDDEKAEFFLRRFGTGPDAPATPDGRFRRLDGSLSPRRVRFWVEVRKRAQELLGESASPEKDYCMTEVVHCKSKRERGVAPAVDLCASLHLDRVIALSPAPLVVVVGSKARNRTVPLWQLPDGFGSRTSMATAPDLSIHGKVLGGKERLVAYLPHPTGMTKLRSFDDIYGARGIDLGSVARGERGPGELLR
jgi:hypothetical protein